MRISGEGRLVVNFKTEAQFHGVFVLSHPGKGPATVHCHVPWHRAELPHIPRRQGLHLPVGDKRSRSQPCST